MIDYDPFEEFRDPQTYDLEDEGYDEDWPLTEQWVRSLGGPLLDLACGTGRKDWLDYGSGGHHARDRARTLGLAYKQIKIKAAIIMRARGTPLLMSGSMSSNAPRARLIISRSTVRWCAQGFHIHSPHAVTNEARATTRETPPAGPAKIAVPLTITGRPGARSPASRGRLKSSPSTPWILKKTTVTMLPRE
jgi:hypothetical protein